MENHTRWPVGYLANFVSGACAGYAAGSFDLPAAHAEESRRLRHRLRVHRRAAGTPVLLLLLLLLYYGVLAQKGVAPVMVAVITFALNVSAHVAELLRSALDAAEHGQAEAAQTLGFSAWSIFPGDAATGAAHRHLPTPDDGVEGAAVRRSQRFRNTATLAGCIS